MQPKQTKWCRWLSCFDSAFPWFSMCRYCHLWQAGGFFCRLLMMIPTWLATQGLYIVTVNLDELTTGMIQYHWSLHTGKIWTPTPKQRCLNMFELWTTLIVTFVYIYILYAFVFSCCPCFAIFQLHPDCQDFDAVVAEEFLPIQSRSEHVLA